MENRLSKLQKAILNLAYRNRLQKAPSSRLMDLSFREILIEVYGLKPISDGPQDIQDKTFIFSRKKIGKGRYNSASAAVAKAVTRLVKRGLVKRKYNRGVDLTEAGTEVAKSLIPSTTAWGY